MIIKPCCRERGIPKQLPQDVIDEILESHATPKQVALAGEAKINALLKNLKEITNFKYPYGLEYALKYTQDKGFVATAPLLIAARAKSDDESLWRDSLMPYSEMHYGLVLNGKTAEPAIIIIHGGGILSKESIPKYIPSFGNMIVGNDGPIPRIRPTIEEMTKLMNGELPNGDNIEIYTLDDINRENIPDTFGRYGVIIRNHELDNFRRNKLSKKDFMDHPIVLAAAGTKKYLEAFFDKSHGEVDIQYFLEIESMYQPETTGLYFELKRDFCLSYCLPAACSGRFIAVNPEGKK